MRRTILIFLAFLPAIAAWLFFRGWKAEDNKGIRRIDSAIVSEKQKIKDEAFVGFTGKGTFYSPLRRKQVAGKDLEYPSAYYLLDEWRRDDKEIFHIKGLLVVQNREPQTLDDVDNLLVIRNDEKAAGRRQRLEKARFQYNSVKATTAKVSGGPNVAESNRFELSEGIEAVIPSSTPTGKPSILKTASALILLTEGKLSTLSLPEEFQAISEHHEVSGKQLLTTKKSSKLVINEQPRIVLGGGQDTLERSLRGKGPLVWSPDALPDGRSSELMDRAGFEFGNLVIESDIVVTHEDMTLRGDLLEARIGDPNGIDRPGSLVSFEIKGNIELRSPKGRVVGDKARGSIGADGSATVVVEGETIALTWQKSVAGKNKTESFLRATSRGPLSLKIPATARRDEEDLVVRMRKEVVLSLGSKTSSRTEVQGENLEVVLSRIPTNRIDQPHDARAWQLTRAMMRGRVVGKSNDVDVLTPKLLIERIYGRNGLHEWDHITLEGPARVVPRGGLGRDIPGAELKTRVTAKRRIKIELPASPFAETRYLAEGHVQVRELGAQEPSRRIDAEHLFMVLAPKRDGLDLGRKVLVELDAKGSVNARDEKNSLVTADEIHIDRRNGRAHAYGLPAKLEYVDAQGRQQIMRAERFHLDSAGGRLHAERAVEADVFFAKAVLNQSEKDQRTQQKKNLQESKRPEVLWHLYCDTLVANFKGTLPLLEGHTNEPVSLLDFDLQGSVRLENAEQILTGNRVAYDLRSRSGWAEGKPAKLVVNRNEDGQKFRDWLEAPRVLLRPEWTLFEGSAKTLIHVRKSGVLKPSDPAPTWEPVRVSCKKDVLVRSTEAFFSGRTHFERGIKTEGGLVLDADRVIARFSKTPGKATRPGALTKIEGFGNVALTWKDLHGEGDVLDFDYVEKKVVMNMETADGVCRMRAKGVEETGKSVAYDLDRKLLKVLEVSGKVLDKAGKKE